MGHDKPSFKQDYFSRKGKYLHCKEKEWSAVEKGEEGGRACEQLLRPDPQLPVPRRASHIGSIGNGGQTINKKVRVSIDASEYKGYIVGVSSSRGFIHSCRYNARPATQQNIGHMACVRDGLSDQG